MIVPEPASEPVPESASESAASDVMRVREIGLDCLREWLTPFGLQIDAVAAGQAIPGSHWGDEEAGLIQHTLYARPDTPVHSVLHEAGHWLVMSPARRKRLHTDAKGTRAEENAVCYLQVLMAAHIPGFSQERLFADMDAWGYNFCLGSAERWFHEDADDALQWLRERQSSLLQQLHCA